MTAPTDAAGYTLAVVGFGTMGQGIAVAAAAAGATVRGYDRDEVLPGARDSLRGRWQRFTGADVAEGDEPGGITVTGDLATAVAGADMVVEAVSEDVSVKVPVLAEVSGLASPDAVVATNTSSLPIDVLADAVTHPRRFVATHFFNPAELVPCVEVAAAPATASATVDCACAVLTAVGKEPVVVRAAPGFIANRLQLALFLEALACVDEGLATPEQVDAVVRRSFGFRLPAYGPFRIADMAGLDVYASILDTLEETYGPQFAQPESLRGLVAEGRLGTKAGRGFAAYTEAEVDALMRERDGRYRRMLGAVDAEHAQD